MPEFRIARHRGKLAVVWYDEDGHRQRRSLGTDDPATAQARLADIQDRIGRESRSARPKVEEIVAAYIRDRTPDVALPARFHDAWKALKPDFGALYPEHINRDRCEAYAAKRYAAGRSAGTVHVELGMLRAAMNWAHRRDAEWLPVAPPVWLPRKPPPRDRHLTRDEAQRLLDACGMPHVRLFVLVALHTVARAGAILDLTWDRVNFERGWVDLRNPERAETRKGRAVVPMNGTLRAGLEEAREAALTPFVIEWGGERVGSIKKGFAAAVRRADVAPCSPHVLRHTGAVWMAEAGISMPRIAAFLGHTDSRTTERVYARFSPDFLADAARALEGPGSVEPETRCA